MSRGPALKEIDLATKVCPTCGNGFFTQVGLDEHVRVGKHDRLSRRWVTGRVSPAGLLGLQERGRQVAQLNNSRRRRCVNCGVVSTPAGIGAHQKASGHGGWTEVVT
ncbi:hypothetical protein [Nocardioides sp. SYSU D00038]|uniref:hypothetical protein n=1 Tax=Nocardioides sp. SYSU D00038 TaxID=2812554 RepID=UPI0019670903|nr:hypothetical protein [Nocardioides sp. SYSU D00038]